MASKISASAKAARVRRPAARGSEIVVRMYNVGFGDCFLIEMPIDDGSTRRMLIDCGSIARATLSMPDVVGLILDDVKNADGVPEIDVVVCTHRHADHVSGFDDPRWKTLKLKEVWFPWTEDPRDAEAKKIRDTQSALAAALQAHWTRQAAAAPGDARIRQLLEVAVNAASNQDAMAMLHGGMKASGARRYLSSEGRSAVIEQTAFPGVKVHVLGPSKKEDVIRDMNPPAHTTYLRQLAAEGDGGQKFEPFGDEWAFPDSAYSWPALKVSPEDADKLKRAASEWDPALTVALEQSVNGTSLVLALEIGDVVLLFPADAQWGTWKAMLAHADTRALLKRASFWKVGHHGSHNATPVDFLENTFRTGCCTMMSTRTGKWASIPRLPLLDAIHAKTKAFARSDEPTKAPAAQFTIRTTSTIETRIPLT